MFEQREHFHRDFAHRAYDNGWLRLRFTDADGEPAASRLGFRFGGVESGSQSGLDAKHADFDRNPAGGRHDPCRTRGRNAGIPVPARRGVYKYRSSMLTQRWRPLTSLGLRFRVLPRRAWHLRTRLSLDTCGR